MTIRSWNPPVAEPTATSGVDQIILEGDCLPHLLALADTPRRFDLVYMDPPFATGRRWGARTGTGDRGRGEDAYGDSWGGIDAFLTMLAPRLEACAALLSDVGSLWLHLDHRAIHDAKVLADKLLGRSSFSGEIIWVPGNGTKRANGPGVTHQTILVYAPSGKMIWNGKDPALREPFADTSLRMHFQRTDEDGRAYRERTIRGKTYRYYADEGRRRGSVWSDCPAMSANTPLTRETTGYPTQKPESLLERIIRAATLPGSQVLDPMCGSGTTVAVALRLGRQGLGMDRGEVALRIARERVLRVLGDREGKPTSS